MTLLSIVRDLRESIGNLSRRKIPSIQGHRGKSSDELQESLVGHRGRSSDELQESLVGHRGKSSDELQESLVAIEQSSWASLPPEVLRDVLKRLKQDDGNWPSFKDVVACASVCTTWRDICKDIARTPEFCGKLTFPVSLKQPGPRDGLIQCFIKRDTSKLTYHLYLSLSTSAMLHDNGKFLLSAKRSRTCMIYTDYTISMDSKNISRSSTGYIGRLRSNFFHTKFIIYDTQPPYNARRFSFRKDPPKVATGSYPIAQVKYESNVLGTRGPRQMQCTMHSIPTSAVDLDGIVPDQSKEMPLVLGNKAPRWHVEHQNWCLNFHGRVTMASVKNFQLIAAPAPPAAGAAASAQPPPSSSSSDHGTVILQFGKVSKDTFTMDYRYPLSAFQAFAICLTSFDTKVSVSGSPRAR